MESDDELIVRIFSLAAQFNALCQEAGRRGLHIQGILKHVDDAETGGNVPDLRVYRLCVKVAN